MPSKILVIAALEPELEALRAHAELLPEDVRLSNCGIGQSAAKNLPHLLEDHSPSALIVFGSSGWLGDAADFKVGRTLLVDRAIHVPVHCLAEGMKNFRFEDLQCAPDQLVEGLSAETGLERACVATMDRPLMNEDHRADIAGATSARLVDMETHFVFQEAAGRGLPAVAVRALSDCAGTGALEEFRQNHLAALAAGARAAVPVIQALHRILERA